MICISIAQESRRFAMVDIRNASRQCDLLEVRLDRFGKAPEINEILQAKPKPVIFSCRRQQDGGAWDGTEEERVTILRQCIVAQADYVEIELDVANQVRKFGPTKRVISYTNLAETPANIAEIYTEAQTKNPDVIKLVTKATTPEEAWPLVQILAKPALPTVVVGVGPSGAMLALLARKMGAPWAYAALERGMETYPEQLTVDGLRSVYRYDDIGRPTRFLGVVGSGEREYVATALMNAALSHLQLQVRCLPLQVGNLRLFRKVLEAVKVGSVVVDQAHAATVRDLASELHGAAERTRLVDLLAQQDESWHGFLIIDRAYAGAINRVMHGKYEVENALEGRTFLIAGTTPLAKAVGQRIAKNGGILIVTDRDRNAAAATAQELQCRQVQFEALYTTLHDVLVFGGDEPAPGLPQAAFKPLHTNYLKPGMTVVDLTAPLRRSPLLRQAEERGCLVVPPALVLIEQVLQHLKLIANKEVPRELLDGVLDKVFIDD
jgi:3-dehydroquinate dehydratase / shikimate dehydrogenase